MKSNFWHQKKATYFAKTLHLIHDHLFISLISLPFLSWWGLPFSWLTILGNIIFSPFFIVFLFLSSMIFFFELLHIPSTWLISLLEYIATWWLFLTSYHSPLFLVSIPSPIAPICIIFIFFSCFFLAQQKTLPKNIGWFLFFLISLIAIKKYAFTPSPFFTIPKGKQHLILITTKEKITLIDPGLLGQRKSSAQWIEYTVIPTIFKNTGLTIIDELIILKKQNHLVEAFSILGEKFDIQSLYAPSSSIKLLQEKFKNLSIFPLEKHPIYRNILSYPKKSKGRTINIANYSFFNGHRNYLK